MPDRYRYTGAGDFYHRGERLATGDIVELGELAASEFGHLFEAVADDGGDETESGSAESETRRANEPGETDSDSATDSEESDAPPDDEQAQAFVDRPWQTVTSDIDDGAADGHLDDVEAAEEARESPRPSVLEAIDERRDTTKE